MKYISYNNGRLVKSTDTKFANDKKSYLESSAYILDISRQRTFDVYTKPNCCCCCYFPSRRIPLFRYQDAPNFLHGNPFVVYGYRGKLPLVLCLQRYASVDFV